MSDRVKASSARRANIIGAIALVVLGAPTLANLSACSAKAATSSSKGATSIALQGTATSTFPVFQPTVLATPTSRDLAATATPTSQAKRATATSTLPVFAPTVTATIPVFNPTVVATPTDTPVLRYHETAGPSGSGTFTNYTNAGGTLGQRVSAYQTVEVGCRRTGWTAPDGDNWWYLIASSPWNNGFYAPADNFYNNGQTSGPITGTPFFDINVPLC